MAQGEFTKEEAQATIDAFKEVLEGLSKTNRAYFIGHANDIYAFLKAAKKEAPSQENEDDYDEEE